jgi:hypothetical protein
MVSLQALSAANSQLLRSNFQTNNKNAAPLHVANIGHLTMSFLLYYSVNDSFDQE